LNRRRAEAEFYRGGRIGLPEQPAPDLAGINAQPDLIHRHAQLHGYAGRDLDGALPPALAGVLQDDEDRNGLLLFDSRVNFGRGNERLVVTVCGSSVQWATRCRTW
jgi:hypothetical protein